MFGHPLWSLAAANQHAQFHVDVQCVAGEVGAAYEQSLIVGQNGLCVQGSGVPVFS